MRRTERDDEMVRWLVDVRFAEMDAIRYALGGLSGSGVPVSLRKAQWWVARMVDAGILDRARPTFRDGSIIWPTHAVTGFAAPNLHRQTTRHQVAIAAVAARYICHGWTWERDRIATDKSHHEVDGIARKDARVDLVEVELTAKANGRYPHIFTNHTWRLQREGATRVAYFCDARTAPVLERQRSRLLHPSLQAQLLCVSVFDAQGRWTADDSPVWASSTTAPQPMTFSTEESISERADLIY